MDEKRAKKLAEIFTVMAGQAASVCLEFDRSGEPCSCCGAVRYAHWEERTIAVKIEGIAEKLANIATEIERRWIDQGGLNHGQ